MGPKGVTLVWRSAMGGSRTGVRSLTRSATVVDEVVRPTAPLLGVDPAARAATQAVAGGPKRSSGSDLRSTSTSSAEGSDLTLPEGRSTRLPTASIGRSLGQRGHQEGRLRRMRQGLLVSSSRRAGKHSPMVPQRSSERSTVGRTRATSCCWRRGLPWRSHPPLDLSHSAVGKYVLTSDGSLTHRLAPPIGCPGGSEGGDRREDHRPVLEHGHTKATSAHPPRSRVLPLLM